ncbi:uroporphyrinogen-III synthase [Edaphobacter paludis]|uniref:Uroporphyrinogen-III synthase n=1 Tax=Edaphobacter paludis TaxID=3035702 RepID=A0AAU7D3L4_9BACT
MLALQNKRILVTRTRHQASDLAVQLEALGAIPILIPTIEIVPPESYGPLDSALAQLETYDWLLFTSANAVEVFGQRRNPAFIPQRIAVIGPATARAVQGIGLEVDLIPPKYVAESLADALASDVSGRRILLVRAADARDILTEMLAAAGATVTVAEAYRNQIPPDSMSSLRQLFSLPANYPYAITFTSASTARNLIALLEAAGLTLPASILLASIGPITSQTLRDLGHPPHLEATEPTISALIQTLVDHSD